MTKLNDLVEEYTEYQDKCVEEVVVKSFLNGNARIFRNAAQVCFVQCSTYSVQF